MKKIYFTLFLALTIHLAYSQGTLQFNQTKLVTDALETVPSGKVWKVTAVYGSVAKCISLGPCYTPLSPNSWAKAEYTGFEVEGVPITSGRFYIPVEFYTNNTCTNDPRSWATGSCQSFAKDFVSNPNILPFWLGEGKTLKAAGSGVFLSVIEFNIVP